MAKVKAWKHGDTSQPSFPEDFEIVKKAVLQKTDIKNNNNKYYAVELHRASGKYRVFTHYGRTDDLETNPNAGAKESRYLNTEEEATACYQSIYKQKTGKSKGYAEVALASSKIGSQKARGTSSGEVDEETRKKLADKDKKSKSKKKPKAVALSSGVQSFVRYIYDESKHKLTNTVAATITAQGIETPLGILTLGQIEKGEDILFSIHKTIKKRAKKAKKDQELESLSGQFYSAIPHKFGRSRSAAQAAIIRDLNAFSDKQETLQLMRDMLQVNGDEGNVLFDAEVDAEYRALNCTIGHLDHSSADFNEIKNYVMNSQVKHRVRKVHNIYTLRRNDGEWDAFDDKVGNERLLFHGSRIANWVGILSRGILMPKVVVSMGVNRTDAGWLGNGIYFGDAACTSYFYAGAGKKGTKFMAVARVGLGKMKDFTKITYGLNSPPAGYDSCHGIRRGSGAGYSQFDDDEFVIYRQNQQRVEYLVEMS